MEPEYSRIVKNYGTDPQIEWTRNWLTQRRDILQKNAEAIDDFSYELYYPKNKSAYNVKDAGWGSTHVSNIRGIYGLLFGSNEERTNKLIQAQIRNMYSTPEGQVGRGTSNYYDLQGTYVEPNPWRNKGSNYIIYAGTPNDDVRVHELTHASHPKQQEQYIRDIIFGGNVPTVVGSRGSMHDNNTRNAKEIYGALQQFRYENKLKPKQKINKKYLEENRQKLHPYLKNIDDDNLLRLFNEVANNGIYLNPRQS